MQTILPSGLLLGAMCFILVPGLEGADEKAAQKDSAGGIGVVHFIEPEKYTDLQRTDTTIAKSREVLLPLIETHIQDQAARHLPAGWRLEVKILDIDQAGYIRSTGPRRMRVVTDSRPAVLKLEYTLSTAPGQVRKSGKESLTGFPSEARGFSSDSEELAIEKRLLRDWIRSLGKR